jgi:hypothetical protein
MGAVFEFVPFGDLWGHAMNELREAEKRAASGALTASRAGRTMLFVHRRDEREAPGLSRCAGSNATRWLLAFEPSDGRFSYRYEPPRYAWADTVRRPCVAAPSRNAIALDPESVIAALHRHDVDAR